jgi:hypothetical protein
MSYLPYAISFAKAYLFLSLLEYSGHRWMMHRMRIANLLDSEWLRLLCINHMVKHHKKPYEHDHHEKDDDPLQLALTALVPALLVSVPLYFYDPLTVKMLTVVGVVYAVLAYVVHNEMHLRHGLFYTQTALYRYLERCHHEHHAHPNSNFNVILPFWDWVFRTGAEHGVKLDQKSKKELAYD